MDLTLRKGAHGLPVRDLQRLLSARGVQVVDDGWFGDDTERAVVEFQRRQHLVADGVAGVKTFEALRQTTSVMRLGEADLQQAAQRLAVPLAAIKAVNEVESRGSGFLPSGRPVILLERHVAYQRAAKADLDLGTLFAQYPNLINPKRGGYAGNEGEWVRFNSLAQITSLQIAIESCSWGAFQVMGYHWSSLGYVSADDFQVQMMSGEPAQLDVFVRFIEADPILLKALRGLKWPVFAKLYNGPAYKENAYDARLAAAYAKAERLAA